MSDQFAPPDTIQRKNLHAKSSLPARRQRCNYKTPLHLPPQVVRPCETKRVKTRGKTVASWCNGSTRDSGSLCQGSSPCEAATPDGSARDAYSLPAASLLRFARKKLWSRFAHSSCITPAVISHR